MKIIDNDRLIAAIESAKIADKKRSHYNLHGNLQEAVQRMCVAIEPDSYVRPHQHPEANKWELLIVLSGAVNVILFEPEGEIIQKLTLSAECGKESGNKAVEIPPKTLHTLVSLEPGSTFMEIKEGPYVPFEEHNFAAWAPRETESIGVRAFLRWCRHATVGDRFNGY